MDLFSAGPWSSGVALAHLEGLRARGPVHRLDDTRFAVLAHREAVAVLSDAKTFTSRFGTGKFHVEVPGRSLNLSDPPHSTLLRRTLRLPKMRDRTRARRLLEALAERGSGDLVTEFAQPLALGTFGEAFELEGEALARLGALTRGLAQAPDAESFKRADQALRSWLDEHRGAPGRFFELGAGLAPRDQQYLQRLLAQTGHESTAMAIALALEVLITRDLPFDPSPAAVNELLRFTSPLIRFVREVTAPTRLGGVALEEGARVAVFFPAVNRDPAVFAHPDEVDLGRHPNPHLAFGAGPHACFGAELARQQLTDTLEAFARIPRPTLGKRVALRSSVTRGFASVALRLHGEAPG